MNRFKTDLLVRHLNSKDRVVLSPFEFESDRVGTTITVPAGFVTDFGSVPRLPVVYLTAGGIGDEAATIHDYLYQTHLVKRRIADKIFLDALKVMGVRFTKRWTMYLAVRLGGIVAYKTGLKRFTILNKKRRQYDNTKS